MPGTFTLASSIDADDLAIVVSETIAGLPDAGEFTIGSERIRYTSKTDGTKTFNIPATDGRGFDGSTAAIHSSGAKAYFNIIAYHHNALLAEVRALQTELGITGSQTFLRKDGTVPLTAAWDAGSFQIRAETFQSDVATGTAPFTVASTTKVTNLNADLFDGLDSLAFVKADGTVPLTANWDVGAFKVTASQLESDVVTGTAPLIVASTTKVTNLNSDLFDDQTGTYYLDRTNHTGTQLASTVSDFSEAVDDRVAVLVQNGTGLTWTYDDGLNTLTGAVSLSPFNTTNLSEGTNLYYTQARFDSAFTAKSTTDLSEGTNLYYTDERVDDRVATLLVEGTGITLVYDDGLNTLTINGGNVTKVGTPANNQVAMWTGDGTAEGDADFTWDEATLLVSRDSSGNDVTIHASNLTNSSGADTIFKGTVAGTASGDVIYQGVVTSGSTWSWGIDNSDSDKFRIEPAATLGAATGLTITTGGLFGIGTVNPEGTLHVMVSDGAALVHADRDDYIFEASNTAGPTGMTIISGTGQVAGFQLTTSGLGTTNGFIAALKNAGSNSDTTFTVQATDVMVLRPAEVDFLVGAKALGGGSAATLGTIGGSGPTTAGQAQWLQIKIAGTTHWIPAWV